jgi:hypothetical protein
MGNEAKVPHRKVYVLHNPDGELYEGKDGDLKFYRSKEIALQVAAGTDAKVLAYFLYPEDEVVITEVS